jgi:D-alanyl-D-alanine carboxypeptidase
VSAGPVDDRAVHAVAAVAELVELARDARRHFPLAGGVITIADRHGTLAEAPFGDADVERAVPMDSHRRFAIGSISKLFASLVVNRLVDDGRLGLGDAIGDLLAWAELPGPTRQVTIERLLNHTSGLGVGSDSMADDAAEVWSSRRYEPSSSTDVRFHYSNLGYQLLGEAVRAVTGRRLADLEDELLLGPLQMRGAIANVSHEDRESLVPGYWPQRTDQPWAPGDAIERAPWLEVDSASGNIAATGSDMARLIAALLAASAGEPVRADDGSVVLDPATVARMTTALAPGGEPTYVPDGVAPVEDSRYGMGINVESVDGHRCWTHGGGMVGYSTFLLVDCTAGVGISVMTSANGDTLAAHLLARAGHAYLIRRLRGQAPTARVSLDPTVRGDDGLLRHAFGAYAPDDGGPRLEVGAAGDDAPVRVDMGGASGRLYRRANGRFVTDNPRLRRFHLDLRRSGDDVEWSHGEVTYLRDATDPAPARERHVLTGHYRSYSPWFPEFRVIERGGRLLLAAPGGVEAPDAEQALVELAPGVFRVGEDPWLPERLIVEASRAGEVVALDRDGCRYSRVFSG